MSARAGGGYGCSGQTQQGPGGTRVEDGSERGALRQALHQPIVEGLEEKVNIRVPHRVDWLGGRTLSLILCPLSATRTGIVERSMYVKRWGA